MPTDETSHANVRTDAQAQGAVRTVVRTAVRMRTGAQTLTVLRMVTALVALCALTQFAIQAWLTYSFAAQVWRIPGPLCAAVIAALDLFVTVFMFLTYLLRGAHWRVRTYVWLVLAGGIGAQLFAAELFAQHESWAGPVRIFAGLPALFLAASLHGLIKYRQHMAAPADTPAPDAPPTPAPTKNAQASDRRVSTTAEQAAGRASATQPPPRPKQVPAAADTRPAVQDDVVQVRKLVAEGMSCKDAAAELGKSKRWAESKTKDIRERRDAAQSNGRPPANDVAATEGRTASFPKGNGLQEPAMKQDLAPTTALVGQ